MEALPVFAIADYRGIEAAATFVVSDYFGLAEWEPKFHLAAEDTRRLGDTAKAIQIRPVD